MRMGRRLVAELTLDGDSVALADRHWHDVVESFSGRVEYPSFLLDQSPRRIQADCGRICREPPQDGRIQAQRYFQWLIRPNEASFRREAQPAQKQTFYHELQQFLTSGIPLPQAVEALMPETRGDVRRVLAQLLKLFLAGESVPGAFASLRPTVSSLEISLIEASSNTGRLEQSFVYLSNYFGALETVRAKVVKGLIWPAVPAARRGFRLQSDPVVHRRA